MRMPRPQQRAICPPAAAVDTMKFIGHHPQTFGHTFSRLKIPGEGIQLVAHSQQSGSGTSVPSDLHKTSLSGKLKRQWVICALDGHPGVLPLMGAGGLIGSLKTTSDQHTPFPQFILR